MQVVVQRSSLLSPGGDIDAYCTYDDNTNVSMNDHPQGTVLLRVKNSSVVYSDTGMKLIGDWREANKEAILSSEAEQRIGDVFPDYAQRSAIYEIENYIITHGADASRWPSNAQKRRAEIDRCWTYVNAVRARAKQMGATALSGDPTQDSRWPAKIAPYAPS